MKKLKNPEKYIRVLKNRIAWIQENADGLRKDLFNAVGRRWFTYGVGVEQKALLGLHLARRCQINDEVLIHGNVKSIVPDDGENYIVTFHVHDVRIKEAP